MFTKLGTTAPPAPQKLPVDSLKIAYAGSRALGRRARARRLGHRDVAQCVQRLARASLQRPGRRPVDSIVGYEKMIAGQVVPEVGDKLNVVGVGDFAFAERRIAPRNDADITFLTPGRPRCRSSATRRPRTRSR